MRKWDQAINLMNLRLSSVKLNGYSSTKLPVGSSLLPKQGCFVKSISVYERDQQPQPASRRCAMEEEKVGRVEKFFAKPGVAAIEVTAGTLKIGDKLHFKGHTTDFEETVTSMQVENQPIEEARPGDLVGIQVKERVRENDTVFRVA
jgi:putative protease